MSDEIRQLIPYLQRKGDDTKTHRGVIVSVDTVNKTAVVTIAGGDVGPIPYLTHLTLSVGNNVDVLFMGKAPRITGVSA